MSNNALFLTCSVNRRVEHQPQSLHFREKLKLRVNPVSIIVVAIEMSAKPINPFEMSEQ